MPSALPLCFTLEETNSPTFPQTGFGDIIWVREILKYVIVSS